MENPNTQPDDELGPVVLRLDLNELFAPEDEDDDPGIGLGELDDFEDPLDDYYEDEDWDEGEEDDGPDYDSDEGWDPFD